MKALFSSKKPKASVWKIQAIETAGQTLLSGTLLSGLPKLIASDERTFSNFSKMIRSYFSKTLAGTEIQVEVDGQSHSARTDRHGNFQLDLDKCPSKVPEIKLIPGGRSLPILQSYPVIFRRTKAPYLVVSDIDDTILVTHTYSRLARLRVLLFNAPADRKAVDATRLAFEMLDTEHVQFMYLSRSEINLFHLITDFLQHHSIPTGPVFLRDYVQWHSLFAGKDHHYKIRRMEWVLRAFPNKKLLFFGDDSQKDLEAFTYIAGKYQDRVHSIFIRRTGKVPPADKEARLEASAIPVIHYERFSDIQDTIQTLMHEITAAR